MRILCLPILMLGLAGCPHPEERIVTETTAPINTPKLIYLSGSQKCLAFDQAGDGRVYQGTCAKNGAPIIEIVESSDKTYAIAIPEKNLCLEAENASTGSRVVFAPCNSGARQRIVFQTSKVDHLFHKIVFTHSGKCLGTSELRRANGIPLVQNDCRDVIWQDFLFADLRATKAHMPRVIWSFWDKGEAAMPAFYRANLKRWEKVLNQGKQEADRWEIKVLNLLKGNENYFGNFISEDSIPDLQFIASKIGNSNFESRLKPAVIFSDFLRLELLYKFGGVWMDPSIMLHEPFDDIFSAMEVLENFTMAAFTSRSQGEYPLRYADSFENFFIASFPKVEVMDVWKSNFRYYWDLKQPEMPIQTHPLYNGSRGVKLNLSPFGGGADYLNEHVAFKYTLVTNPRYLQQVLILGDTQGGEKGPFTLLGLVNWNDNSLLRLSPVQIDATEAEIRDVLISKFPSENSRNIRTYTDISFFFANNLFGRLNRL